MLIVEPIPKKNSEEIVISIFMSRFMCHVSPGTCYLLVKTAFMLKHLEAVRLVTVSFGHIEYIE